MSSNYRLLTRINCVLVGLINAAMRFQYVIYTSVVIVRFKTTRFLGNGQWIRKCNPTAYLQEHRKYYDTHISYLSYKYIYLIMRIQVIIPGD